MYEWLARPGGLADRLVAMRKAAGLTGDQLATSLGWVRSKVSKLENGRQAPSEQDLADWVRACGGDETVHRQLLDELASGRAAHRLWRHELRRGQAELQGDLDDLVRRATRIRNFEITLIPGLIQTAGYARHRVLENIRVYGADEHEVDAAVAARMRRQDVLHDGSKTFEFLLHEAALRVRFCPSEVMLGQLDRLLSLAGMPNLTIGIVPFDAEPSIAPLNGFLMLDDVTFVETFASEIQVHGDESAAYDRIAGFLRDAAVTGEPARQLILTAQNRLRAG
jgi:transcriptional regulator with XRE-family HTH domain